jgi:hypothetical protein
MRNTNSLATYAEERVKRLVLRNLEENQNGLNVVVSRQMKLRFI